jgi:hypothetical protein
VDAFLTIQDGIDAVADGGRVSVNPGIYLVNVIGSKGVTLAPGSSPGQVTIDGNLTHSTNTTLEIEPNTIQVRVEDDGVPFLSDTNSFLVIVNALSGPAVLMPSSWSNDAFTFSITGPIGPDYIIQRTSDWTTWTSVWTNTPVAVPLTFTDMNGGGFGNRFYRVMLGP